MLGVVYFGETELSASSWDEGGLRTHLWQPNAEAHALDRMLRVLGTEFEKVIWVGKPLRDTLTRLAVFPWPGSWPAFRRFISDNPLSTHGRVSGRLKGEFFYYPREWVEKPASPVEHARLLEQVLALKLRPSHDESHYCPFPREEELLAWCAKLGVERGAPSGGRGLDWQSGGRYWIENGERRELSREENSALWEPRDLWALFHAGKLAYARVGAVELLSPVGRSQ